MTLGTMCYDEEGGVGVVCSACVLGLGIGGFFDHGHSHAVCRFVRDRHELDYTASISSELDLAKGSLLVRRGS
jgi:uncharacterized membrane protein